MLYIPVKTEVTESVRQVPSLENNTQSSSQSVISSSAPATLHILTHTGLKTLPANTVAIKNTLQPTTNVSVATKTALLERIASTGNQITPSNLLLAGHLTGAIPITGNSGLVATNTSSNQSVNILSKNQSAIQTQSVLMSEPQTLYLTQRHQTVAPEQWSVVDVCHFLKYNDCSAYVEIFHRKVRRC